METLEKIVKISSEVFAGKQRRRLTFWASCYGPPPGHHAWLCLSTGQWANGQPVPVDLVAQVRRELVRRWPEVRVYELTPRGQERYAPNLRYSSPEKLHQVLLAS